MEIVDLMVVKKYFVKDTGSCRLEECNQSHASRNDFVLYFTSLLFVFPVSFL